MNTFEYSATEIRKILQGLFPHRRLVLSQFTFFNQIGIAKPTGSSFKRGRRCYRLQDILSIACILALKEEGIPFKNIETLPPLIQEHAERIFLCGEGCRLSGHAEAIALRFPGDSSENPALTSFLSGEHEELLFWGFDIGLLAEQLRDIAEQMTLGRTPAPLVVNAA